MKHSVPMRIKQARLLNGMSQAALASALSVSVQAISQWERGKTEPTRLNVERMAEVLKCSVDYLYARESSQDGRPILELPRVQLDNVIPVVDLDFVMAFGYINRPLKAELVLKEAVIPTRKLDTGVAVRLKQEDCFGDFSPEDVLILEFMPLSCNIGEFVVVNRLDKSERIVFGRLLKYPKFTTLQEHALELEVGSARGSRLLFGDPHPSGLIIAKLVERRTFWPE